MANVNVHIDLSDPRWQSASELENKLKEVVSATLDAIDYDEQSALSVRLSQSDEVQLLNRDFRNKDKPTNVLSFPDGTVEAGETYLGDIIIAYEVVEQEAADEGKSLLEHTLHMAVHGTLHLLGHDHQENAEAEKMETLEERILAQFGIASPYA